jgi:hypothetical protein
MDEFADLEDELRSDQISADTESIKSLVKSIEYNELEPTIFFKDRNANWNVTKRICFVVLGIVTLPLLGLGLVFIYVAFDNGPFFENCEIVEAKVYLAEQNLVIDYRIADDKIIKLQCLSVTTRSYIKHSMISHEDSEYRSKTLHQYHLVTDEHELALLSYESQESLEIRTRINKLISKFAEMANIKISRYGLSKDF